MPHPVQDLVQLLSQRNVSIPPMKGLVGTPSPTPDPYGAAVQKAMQQFPWLKRMGVPIKLTTGKGPYMSESYQPHQEDNPAPGNFTVQLRDQKVINDPSMWPSLLGREGIDYAARNDPTYQSYAQQFRQMMTPDQLKESRKRYEQEKANGQTFQDFLKESELQEYLGGYVLDEPGWRQGGWTPAQRKLLDGLKHYMWQGQTPTPVNIP